MFPITVLGAAPKDGRVHPRDSAGRIPSSILTGKPTERALAVLRLTARGINNGEIAAQLRAVRNHAGAILEKLGASREHRQRPLQFSMVYNA